MHNKAINNCMELNHLFKTPNQLRSSSMFTHQLSYAFRDQFSFERSADEVVQF